jgi:hypothetical protein
MGVKCVERPPWDLKYKVSCLYSSSISPSHTIASRSILLVNIYALHLAVCPALFLLDTLPNPASSANRNAGCYLDMSRDKNPSYVLLLLLLNTLAFQCLTYRDAGTTPPRPRAHPKPCSSLVLALTMSRSSPLHQTQTRGT